MKSKLKILICILCVVAAIGMISITVWALTSPEVKASFKIRFSGKAHVQATINGSSYVNDTKVGDLSSAITIDNDQNAKTEYSTEFVGDVVVESPEDEVSFVFEVKNNSTDEYYSDLIIQPVFSFNEYTAEQMKKVAINCYYALPVENSGVQPVAAGAQLYQDYVALEELSSSISDGMLTSAALTIHKDQTVKIKLQMIMPENLVNFDLTGDVCLNLFSIEDKPAGYREDYKYSVVGENAFRTEVCPTCGKEMGEAVQMRKGTYLIATPDIITQTYSNGNSKEMSHAQSVLDGNYGNINNKVVIFDGEFNEPLILRPTLASNSKAYSKDGAGKIYEVKTDSLAKSTFYRFKRELKNVTFAATEDSIFTNRIVVEGENVSSTTRWYDPNGEYQWDGMRNVTYSANYLPVLEMSNITFSRINFEGRNARIHMSFSAYSEANGVTHKVDGINVENCSFQGVPYTPDELQNDNFAGPLSINAKSTDILKNVRFVNNYVQGHSNGVFVKNAENFTAMNNNICNNRYGIYVYFQNGYYSTGKIMIANNTISDCTQRKITLGTCQNAEILIYNNLFRAESNSQVVSAAMANLTNCEITYVDNVFHTYSNGGNQDVVDYAKEQKTRRESYPGTVSNWTISIDE